MHAVLGSIYYTPNTSLGTSISWQWKMDGYLHIMVLMEAMVQDVVAPCLANVQIALR